MREQIIEEIRRMVREDRSNYYPDRDDRYFAEPLVGVAAADDGLFDEYKEVIGLFHLTPRELVSVSTPEDVWQPRSVICWVLPVNEAARSANRREQIYPSREWALMRNFGEQFNSQLRRHIIVWLSERGYRAAAPQLMSAWRELADSPVGVASTWSERHAAYAAGLGTFSLNDALITPAGIAHRLGSIITDLELEPSPRRYPERRANCLYFRDGTCGACIARCPAGALSKDGHNKNKCRTYVYETIISAVAEQFGVSATGCGLCQTKVPCEKQIPSGWVSSFTASSIQVDKLYGGSSND